MSPTEKPVLLSKDIEAKLSLLDREVNYLLNKAKFAKPKPKDKAKDKNSTSTENSKANSTEDAEKVIPPKSDDGETGYFHLVAFPVNICKFDVWIVLLAEEVKPAEEPPTAEKKDEEPILELNPAENPDTGNSQSTNHFNMSSVT